MEDLNPFLQFDLLEEVRRWYETQRDEIAQAVRQAVESASSVRESCAVDSASLDEPASL
jgi:hypothetical protein